MSVGFRTAISCAGFFDSAVLLEVLVGLGYADSPGQEVVPGVWSFGSVVPGVGEFDWMDLRHAAEVGRARGWALAGVVCREVVVDLRYDKGASVRFPLAPAFRLAVEIWGRVGRDVEVTRPDELQMAIINGHLLVPPRGLLVCDPRGGPVLEDVIRRVNELGGTAGKTEGYGPPRG